MTGLFMVLTVAERLSFVAINTACAVALCLAPQLIRYTESPAGRLWRYGVIWLNVVAIGVNLMALAL